MLIDQFNLDPTQYQAVTYTSGPLLVYAGPGAGKTRTLAARTACLLMRMGHQGGCRLHHGTQSMPLEKLAESAICSTSGGVYPTTQREWALLEDTVIPAVCSNAPVMQDVIQQFGPEWSELISVFERK